MITTRLRREHLSVNGSITTDGEFFQHTHHGAVRSPQVVAFLEHLLRHIAGEVVVVLDHAMIHRMQHVWADAGYTGKLVSAVKQYLRLDTGGRQASLGRVQVDMGAEGSTPAAQ